MWTQAIKKYADDTNTKYKMPKKDSAEYLEVRKIYDKLREAELKKPPIEKSEPKSSSIEKPEPLKVIKKPETLKEVPERPPKLVRQNAVSQLEKTKKKRAPKHPLSSDRGAVPEKKSLISIERDVQKPSMD